MKTKGKGKAIIGIAMAAIMLASVMVAMVPAVSARGATSLEIDADNTVFIGEQGLTFDTDNDGVYGDTAADPNNDLDFTLEGVVGTSTEDQTPIQVDAHGWTVPLGVILGKYTVNLPVADIVGGLDTGDTIYIDEAKITGDVILNTATQDTVVGKTIPVSSSIVFKIEPTFGGLIGVLADPANVKIKLKDSGGMLVNTLDGIALTTGVSAASSVLYVSEQFPAPAGTTDAPGTGAWIGFTPEPATPNVVGGFEIAGLSEGTYTVTFEADKATCNMLGTKSPAYEFTVRSEELSIKAEKDTVAVGEKMIITVSGNPKTYYYVIITGQDVTAAPAILSAGDVKARDDVLLDVAGDASTVVNQAAWVQTGTDGTAKLKIATTNADDRTYKIRVFDPTAAIAAAVLTTPPAATYDTYANVKTPSAAADEKKADVKVKKAEATFDMPASVIIGETVTIKGVATAGDDVDILIDDAYDANVDDNGDEIDIDANKEFEADWDTGGYMPGSYTIKAYIDCAGTLAAGLPAGEKEEGSTTIRLVAPGLTAEQPRNVVAETDDYEIKGTATGVDDVDIVLVGPKGYRAGGFGVANGLLITSASVTDNEFSEEITMGGAGFDTGLWTVLVLSPGRDTTYGDLGVAATAGNLDAATGAAMFAGKTTTQIIALLKSRTVDVADSDDILKSFTFKVESGRVDLDPVAAVKVGDPLNITGTTNRESGTMITISRFAGPSDLPAALAKVEWPTGDTGVFTATIDTTGAAVGTYTILADDGDGNTDTIDVEILTEVPVAEPTAEPTATPEPTAKPTAAPAPTAAPTAEPTAEPTPEPPGFEVVFAIAGMLAIAYLVLRKRRE